MNDIVTIECEKRYIGFGIAIDIKDLTIDILLLCFQINIDFENIIKVKGKD